MRSSRRPAASSGKKKRRRSRSQSQDSQDSTGSDDTTSAPALVNSEASSAPTGATAVPPVVHRPPRPDVDSTRGLHGPQSSHSRVRRATNRSMGAAARDLPADSHRLVKTLLVAAGLGDCVPTLRKQEVTLPVLLSLTAEDMRELGFTLGKRKRLAALIELIKEEHRQRGLRHKYVSPRAASTGSLPRLAEEDDGGVVSTGAASRDAGAGAGAGAGVSTTATATGYVPPVLSLDPQIHPADGEDGNPALVQSRGTGVQGGDRSVHVGSTAPVPIAINASGRRSLGGRSHGRTSSSSPSHNAFHMSMASPGVREPLLVHVREELGSTMTPIFEDNMSFASRESFDSWRRSVEDISRRALSMGDFAPSLPSEFTKDFEAAQEREKRLKLRRLRRARNEGGGCTQCSPAAKCALFTLLSTLVIIAALVVIAVVLKPRPSARPPVIGVHLIPLQPSHNHSHHHHRHHRRWIPLQPSHNSSNASATVWGRGTLPTPDSASHWTDRAWWPWLQGWLPVRGTVVHLGLRGSMPAAPAS